MLRLWLCMKAGDEVRDTLEPGLAADMRDWKRRSKGRREGIGELRPEREAMDGRTLLPGDEKLEPYVKNVSMSPAPPVGRVPYLYRCRVVRDG